jgi:hypothetical protein
VTYKPSYSSFLIYVSKIKFGDGYMHLLRNKKGLSVVVTTLIILVVSVLLATVVTFYAINVTTTRVQEESLHLSKQHVWYNTSGGWAEAALVILNSGGRDVVIDKISVRGQECPWANVWYWRDDSTVISADLNCTTLELSTLAGDLDSDGTFTYTTDDFQNAGDDVTLKSGWTLVMYIMNPDSIALNDVGIPVGITVFTSNAQYHVETNVAAAQ